MDSTEYMALDIETECGVEGCDKRCDHALLPERSRITIVGVYTERDAKVFTDLVALERHLLSIRHVCLIGHNLKFDLRHLKRHGLDLSALPFEDTLLQAHVHTEKVSESWLLNYESLRTSLNREGGSSRHRKAGPLSLKTLAPYFLGVDPFWEPINHNDKEYVLKDAQFTYWLFKHFEKVMNLKEKHFYENKLKPWTKLLMEMEDRGISIDLCLLTEMKERSQAASDKASEELKSLWSHVYEAWENKEEASLRAHYMDLYKKSSAKKYSRGKRSRYLSLYKKAREKLEPFSIDSSSQLMWAMRDFLGYSVTDFEGEETTGKEVLNELSKEHQDIALLSTYRKERKLATAFFPSYEEMHTEGVLHTSFKATGTVSGRLSSATPNLQQVASSIRDLFVSRPGYLLCTYDMSAIEPRLIAHYTQDKTLVELLATGADFHGYNAKVFFDLKCEVKEVKAEYPLERKMAKEVGLSLFYGAGPNRILGTSKKYALNWDEEKCKEVFKRFKRAYSQVFDWRDQMLNKFLKAGFTTENILKRPIKFTDPDEVPMHGFNRLIQGSASDMVWNAAYKALETFREKNLDAFPLLLVHDEIVFEVKESDVEASLEVIRDAMTSYKLNNVHLEIEGKVDTKWSK